MLEQGLDCRDAYTTSILCVSEWPSSLSGERQDPGYCMEYDTPYRYRSRKDFIAWLPGSMLTPKLAFAALHVHGVC